jgi:toxin-antitoxin system PIN domain toxin
VAALLDVNALIALVDAYHVQHEAMHRWFDAHAAQGWTNGGWATCPITENGMVRVLSQPVYPSGQCTPSVVIDILRVLKKSYEHIHEFWADDVSICDDLFQQDYIIGTRQVTDAYLLGLAAKRGGRVVSFDRSLPWQAIRGGTEQLIETPR